MYKTTIDTDNLKVIEIWNNTTIDESAHKIIQFISDFMEKEEEKEEEEEEKEQEV